MSAAAAGPGDAPIVSIGLPVYNGERFLEQTLRAILEQTWTDLELVISDNASTDGTEKICRAFAAADPRVRYDRCERNLGAATNYNRVFELSRGRYFKWAAADDLFATDYIQRCVAVLDAEPEVVLAFSRTKIIDESGAVVRDYDDAIHLRETSPPQRFQRFFELVGECNAVFGLIRAPVLARTARIGNYIGSDVVLLAELSLHGQLHRIDDHLFLRREHAAASSWKKDDGTQQEFFDPRIRGRVEMRAWRHHAQQLRAVARAPLSFADRATVTLKILRHGITVRHELWRELAARFGPRRRG